MKQNTWNFNLEYFYHSSQTSQWGSLKYFKHSAPAEISSSDFEEIEIQINSNEAGTGAICIQL